MTEPCPNAVIYKLVAPRRPGEDHCEEEMRAPCTLAAGHRGPCVVAPPQHLPGFAYERFEDKTW